MVLSCNIFHCIFSLSVSYCNKFTSLLWVIMSIQNKRGKMEKRNWVPNYHILYTHVTTNNYIGNSKLQAKTSGTNMTFWRVEFHNPFLKFAAASMKLHINKFIQPNYENSKIKYIVKAMKHKYRRAALISLEAFSWKFLIYFF